MILTLILNFGAEKIILRRFLYLGGKCLLIRKLGVHLGKWDVLMFRLRGFVASFDGLGSLPLCKKFPKMDKSGLEFGRVVDRCCV